MSESSGVPGNVSVLKIVPSESNLKDVKTNIPCPVKACSSIFKSSSNLTMHLEKYHKIIQGNQSSLEKKNASIVYHYHCPVQRCRYHLDLKSPGKNFFHQLKYLKQHFLKVHSAKRFTCADCNKSFSLEAALKRHKADCGIEYKCSCGQVYLSRYSLLLHANRKNHSLNEISNSIKMDPVPIPRKIVLQLHSPVCIIQPQILPKPTILEPAKVPNDSPSSELDKINDNERKFLEHNYSVLTSTKEKHVSRILKKRSDLSSLVKRKIVLSKVENAKKLMKMEHCGNNLELSAISKDEGSSEELSHAVEPFDSSKEKNQVEFGSEPKLSNKSISDKTSINDFNYSWCKGEGGLETNDASSIVSCTDVNLNVLNNSNKNCPFTPSIFDNFEFSNSPKLSQSTQTNESLSSNLATTQTDFYNNFEDSNLSNYYDNFEFSNSPKLSQSTQTFQSSSQISQTDIQSSYFDDSSNKSFLSELIGCYDNFESSNSPKLSQSTQTIEHSSCSWSDNVTQTDLDDHLFEDLFYCKNEASFSGDVYTVKIPSPRMKSVLSAKFCDSVTQTCSATKYSDESVSTQTGTFLIPPDDKKVKPPHDDFTNSETQTDLFPNSYVITNPKIQNFTSIQTQTSSSLNHLIDSETQTQNLFNQFIDIQTQTHVSNFN